MEIITILKVHENVMKISSHIYIYGMLCNSNTSFYVLMCKCDMNLAENFHNAKTIVWSEKKKWSEKFNKRNI